MPDVFLTYARDDWENARIVAEALERRGHSVWWDLEMVSNQNSRRRIEDAVQQARCVVVLWTPRSVASVWVRGNATFAQEQRKLLPVLLEDADIPLPFRLIHTADLRDWHGEENHLGLREVEGGVQVFIEGTAGPASPVGNRKGKADGDHEWKVRWERLISLGWLALPSVVVALCAGVLMHWPAPARIEIHAAARLAQFRTYGEEPQVLLEGTSARSLALRGFEEVRFAAVEISIANPAQYDLQRDAYPEDAWTRLPSDRDVVLRPADQTVAATVTIQPVAKSSGSLILDRIFAGPTEVTLESPEKGTLSLKLRGLKQTGAVSLPEEFRVVADFCTVDGAPLPYSRQSITFLARRPQGTRLLEFSSAESGILFVVEIAPGGRKQFLGGSGLAVDRVEFVDQGPLGQRESTLDGAGMVRYDEKRGVEPVKLQKGDFLVLDDLRQFRLLEAALTEEENNLWFRLHGVAGRLASGPLGSVRDLRLTQFDRLWGSPKLAAVFTILAWLVPTFAALRHFLRGETPARTGRTKLR